MYFIYYKNGNLFKPKPSPREICKENGFTENVHQQSTAVMSSGVLGESVKNLTEKVIIKFHVNNPKVWEMWYLVRISGGTLNSTVFASFFYFDIYSSSVQFLTHKHSTLHQIPFKILRYAGFLIIYIILNVFNFRLLQNPRRVYTGTLMLQVGTVHHSFIYYIFPLFVSHIVLQ